MAWYRAGTVSVTNGSPVVTGTNTDFVSNIQIGEAFIGPDRLTYEIAQVISATQIVLADNYGGATGAGQGYKIQPTSSFARDLALGTGQLVNTFAVVRDGIGQGLFPDGTVTTPGVRFAQDQDTGIYRSAQNNIGIVAAGVQRIGCSPAGTYVLETLDVSGTVPVLQFGSPVAAWSMTIPAGNNALTFVERQFGSEKMRLDSGGSLLVGVTTGNEHNFQKNVAQGSSVLRVQTSGAGAAPSMIVAGVTVYTPSGSGAAIYIGHSSVTNRSINASGTINASGADYAEYMVKAAGCGAIAKGDVCGVDGHGQITRSWADAIVFKIKSTDPSLVGGDSWAAHLPPKPESPGAAPVEPVAPALPDGDAVAAELQAYDQALAVFREYVAVYPAAKAKHDDAVFDFERDLRVWEAALEKARQTVDRIAYCGRVPVNFAEPCQPGDYLVAIANGGGIGLKAVAEADITFAEYRHRVGRVLSIGEDGRPIVDVMQG